LIRGGSSQETTAISKWRRCLSFADRADPDVVCIGYPTGMLWIEEIAEVISYNAIFHHLQATALSPDESVALMISVLKEL